MQAYQKFQISSKVHDDMEQSLGSTYLPKPIFFKLLDEKHEDITYRVFFENKDSLEKETTARIRSIPSSLGNIKASAEPVKQASRIDPEAFKALAESKTVSYEGIKVNVKSVSLSSQWVFDGYGDEWRYRSAERGSKYIVAKISISSKTNNPELPPLSVYKIKDGNTEFRGSLQLLQHSCEV